LAPLQSSLIALGLSTLLSWDSSALTPPSIYNTRCPLPEPEGSFGQAIPLAWSRSACAVSHRPDGLLHPGAAGLLHPATDREVRPVSDLQRQPTQRQPVPCAPFPRRGSHPSKNSPRQQPYRVTAASALLPLPLALPSLRECRVPLWPKPPGTSGDPRATRCSLVPALARRHPLATALVRSLSRETEASRVVATRLWDGPPELHITHVVLSLLLLLQEPALLPGRLPVLGFLTLHRSGRLGDHSPRAEAR
jgi:hypothetical protein